MTWVRLDDQHDIHRKVARLSHLAYRVWVSGMAWCHRQRTPGVVPSGDEVLIVPGAKPKEIAKAVAELVSARLWHATQEGYEYHDWQSYQTTPGATPQERGRAGAAKRWGSSKDARGTLAEAGGKHAEGIAEPIAKPVSYDGYTDARPVAKPIANPVSYDGYAISKGLANDAPIPIPNPNPDPPIAPPCPASVPSAPALELAPPGGEPEETRQKRPRKPPEAPHPVVSSHYVAEFTRIRGVSPPFGSREGAAVAKILRELKGDVEQARKVVTNGLSAKLGNPQTIVSIANDPAKWLVPPPEPFKNAARSGPPQPNCGAYQFHDAPEGGF